MPPRSKKPSRFDLIPPGASFEDDVQLDELRQSWSLRVGEFLRLARERYGITEHRDDELGHYLRSPEGRVSPLPEGLAVDDQLDPDETAMLCLTLGIPPVDFGLPDESD
jgi:hypothetical protein